MSKLELTCPQCKSPAVGEHEQPQPGEYEFSTIFRCGSQIVIITDAQKGWEWQKKCTAQPKETAHNTHPNTGKGVCSPEQLRTLKKLNETMTIRELNEQMYRYNTSPVGLIPDSVNISWNIFDSLKITKEVESPNVVYAREEFVVDSNSIFLAGPTPRDPTTPSWRPAAVDILKKNGFKGTVFVPEDRVFSNGNFEYGDQIEWEATAMENAKTIVFWVPRELKSMPAFTTNIEFGYWMCKNPGKLVLGAPINTPKMDYLRYYCNKLGIPNFYTQEETLIRAIMKTQK